MHHDEGMPAGVSEKNASCEMSEVGEIISSTGVRPPARFPPIPRALPPAAPVTWRPGNSPRRGLGMQDFNRCWREVEKLGTDEGSNVRLFRAEYEDPSPNSDKLEKASSAPAIAAPTAHPPHGGGALVAHCTALCAVFTVEGLALS